MPRTPEERIVELELLLTHLERTQGELHDALCAQQRQLDLLTGRVARLEGTLSRTGRDEPDADAANEDEAGQR